MFLFRLIRLNVFFLDKYILAGCIFRDFVFSSLLTIYFSYVWSFRRIASFWSPALVNSYVEEY